MCALVKAACRNTGMPTMPSLPTVATLTARPSSISETSFYSLRQGSPAKGAVSASRLEELDGVAGGIVEQDLSAAGAGHDLVSEGNAFAAQAVDLCLDVVDDEVDAVPAARNRCAAVRHRPAGRAGRPAQQEPERAAADIGESRGHVRDQTEAEVIGVEVDRGLDVGNEVADVDRLVAHGW